MTKKHCRMEKALEKLEKLSENVRLIDQPRSYSHYEVKKLIEIAYLEGKNAEIVNSDIEKEINYLLKTF